MNAVELWLAACGLPFLGPCLRPDPGILRLGACSFWPLIFIRGPKRSQLLLIILSSAAMVSSWPGDACDTSIVNFFMFLFYLLIVFVSGRLQLEACGLFL